MLLFVLVYYKKYDNVNEIRYTLFWTVVLGYSKSRILIETAEYYTNIATGRREGNHVFES